jgi:hypothetical protein
MIPARSVEFNEFESQEKLFQFIHDESIAMAEAMCAHRGPEAVHAARLVIYEFTKNALHGENGSLHYLPLADGSLLVVTTDFEGKDQLDPSLCGHMGTQIIEILAGEENYHQLKQGEMYISYLRIDPDNMATE